MAAVTERPSSNWSLDQLCRHFGDIPPDRLMLDPAPGTATEEDCLQAVETRDRLCELIDGCLVEKAMGSPESILGLTLAHAIQNYLLVHDVGVLLGPDALLRLMPGQLRLPDVSVITWERLGTDEFPQTPITDFAPDLAIEVISPGNTRQEMDRKIADYFHAGTAEVWLVYPRKKMVAVYDAPDQVRTLTEEIADSKVLPGFVLSLEKLFAVPRRRRGTE